MVTTIDQTGRQEFGCLLPQDAGGRRRRRELADAAPAFENHVLAEFSAFLLAELAVADHTA